MTFSKRIISILPKLVISCIVCVVFLQWLAFHLLTVKSCGVNELSFSVNTTSTVTLRFDVPLPDFLEYCGKALAIAQTEAIKSALSQTS